MSDRPTIVEGVPAETLEQVRERILSAEREKLDQKLPRGVRVQIKEIIEQEITDDYING